jgi:hypothetical protein
MMHTKHLYNHFPGCCLTLVYLWNVLNNGDKEFNVGAKVEEVEPFQDRTEGQDQADAEKQGDAGDDQLAGTRHTLMASLNVKIKRSF